VAVIEDDETIIEQIDEFVKILWTVPKQIAIDSKLLEITLNDDESLGLKWDAKATVEGHSSVVASAASPNTPGFDATSFFTFGISSNNLNATLQALAVRKRADLRSNPRVLVMNHRTATIVVGEEIPYLSSVQSTGAQPINTYDFKQATLRLEVTPHVGEGDVIFMDVHPTIKSVIDYIGTPRQPVLSVREAATNVAVNSGTTLIIGGLVQRNIQHSWSETPYLARVPLVGLLFSQKQNTDAKTDLLFLLCPRVVTPEAMREMVEGSKMLTTEPLPHNGESSPANPKW
jgi:general secretion pathway protein D